VEPIISSEISENRVFCRDRDFILGLVHLMCLEIADLEFLELFHELCLELVLLAAAPLF
jgi:hypothetical protein